MKSLPKQIAALAISLLPVLARAEIQGGEPLIDRSSLSNPEINCLVRYGGMTSIKKHYPNSPLDKEVRDFDKYLETGEPGQHGVTLPLTIAPESPFSGYLKLTPFEFIEKEFALEFTVTDSSGNTFIKKDAHDANGTLALTITDLQTGSLVATADFPIEMFFTGGYTIPQVTVGLPTRLIDSQKKTLTWDKDLLTQVRFQCN